MTSSIWTVTIDSIQPQRLAEFWAQALGWRVDPDGDDDEVAVEKPDGSDDDPALLFLRVPEQKAGKNRIHLDLNPGDDQEAEVRRLEDLGARRVDIGQGKQTWVVMADPEGNEFCVLSARKNA
jgi:predicted enzyme related to lactoylglutathione lyase